MSVMIPQYHQYGQYPTPAYGVMLSPLSPYPFPYFVKQNNKSAEQATPDPRKELPEKLPALQDRRQFKTICEPSGAATICLLTYNILHQPLATSSFYKYTPPTYLTQEYRWNNVANELNRYSADVMCLQESTEGFVKYLQAKTQHQKGDSMWEYRHQKRLRNEDGCTILWNKHKWEEVDFHPIGLGVDLNMYKTCDNVAAIVLLRSVGGEAEDNSQEEEGHTTAAGYIFVITTHLYWNPANPEVKLSQINKLVEHLKTTVPEIQKRHDLTNVNVPVVLCGDLNSQPGESVYEKIAEFMVDAYREIGEEEGDKHELYTNYTAQFQGVLDYVFYPKSSNLKPIACLETPSKFKLSLQVALPNEFYSSDHLALAVTFELPPAAAATTSTTPDTLDDTKNGDIGESADMKEAVLRENQVKQYYRQQQKLQQTFGEYYGGGGGNGDRPTATTPPALTSTPLDIPIMRDEPPPLEHDIKPPMTPKVATTRSDNMRGWELGVKYGNMEGSECHSMSDEEIDYQDLSSFISAVASNSRKSSFSEHDDHFIYQAEQNYYTSHKHNSHRTSSGKPTRRELTQSLYECACNNGSSHHNYHQHHQHQHHHHQQQQHHPRKRGDSIIKKNGHHLLYNHTTQHKYSWKPITKQPAASQHKSKDDEKAATLAADKITTSAGNCWIPADQCISNPSQSHPGSNRQHNANVPNNNSHNNSVGYGGNNSRNVRTITNNSINKALGGIVVGGAGGAGGHSGGVSVKEQLPIGGSSSRRNNVEVAAPRENRDYRTTHGGPPSSPSSSPLNTSNDSVILTSTPVTPYTQDERPRRDQDRRAERENDTPNRDYMSIADRDYNNHGFNYSKYSTGGNQNPQRSDRRSGRKRDRNKLARGGRGGGGGGGGGRSNNNSNNIHISMEVSSNNTLTPPSTPQHGNHRTTNGFPSNLNGSLVSNNNCSPCTPQRRKQANTSPNSGGGGSPSTPPQLIYKSTLGSHQPHTACTISQHHHHPQGSHNPNNVLLSQVPPLTSYTQRRDWDRDTRGGGGGIPPPRPRNNMHHRHHSSYRVDYEDTKAATGGRRDNKHSGTW